MQTSGKTNRRKATPGTVEWGRKRRKYEARDRRASSRNAAIAEALVDIDDELDDLDPYDGPEYDVDAEVARFLAETEVERHRRLDAQMLAEEQAREVALEVWLVG